jgi:hypothetical protein
MESSWRDRAEFKVELSPAVAFLRLDLPEREPGENRRQSFQDEEFS